MSQLEIGEVTHVCTESLNPTQTVLVKQIDEDVIVK